MIIEMKDIKDAFTARGILKRGGSGRLEAGGKVLTILIDKTRATGGGKVVKLAYRNNLLSLECGGGSGSEMELN